MSTFHATSISIDRKALTVHLSGYESNVFPKKVRRFESTYLTEMLREQGPKAVDIYLLEQFQERMMKGGNNDYNNTLQLFGQATYENLIKLRELKAANRGVKYVVWTPTGFLLNLTTRRYKATSKERAAQFDIITAMIKSKKVPNSHIEIV